MQKFVLALALTVTLAGCAGRAANPVLTQQYGDASKSCAALEQDMAFVQSEIQRFVPQTDKTGKNVALGVTGAFLLVPWFFMDFSHAEQMEVDALRQRYNRLAILASEKGCDTARRPVAGPTKAGPAPADAAAVPAP